MNDELVERVAEAIYTEWDRKLYERKKIPFRLPWAKAEKTAKDNYRRDARIAIAAVRAWDVEHGPSEAEIAVVADRLVDLEHLVELALKEAADVRARGEVG